MTWVVIAVVLALALNVPRLLIFGVLFPVVIGGARGTLRRRAHYFLHAHSAAYRRWCRQRFILSFRRLEKAFGQALLPAVKKATAAFDDWNRAMMSSPIDDVQSAFRDA